MVLLEVEEDAFLAMKKASAVTVNKKLILSASLTKCTIMSHLVIYFAYQALCDAGIEDLRQKRDEIQRQIEADEHEKRKVQEELQSLTQQLSQITDSLSRKVFLPAKVYPVSCTRDKILKEMSVLQLATRNEYDKVRICQRSCLW